MTDNDKVVHSDRVRQAQRMVAEQASCSTSAAHALMMNTAEATDETLEQIADEVLTRNVTFAPPPA